MLYLVFAVQVGVLFAVGRGLRQSLAYSRMRGRLLEAERGPK